MAEGKNKPPYASLPIGEEAAGKAPGRGRLTGKRILIVGGGQRTVDAETDPVGNGRAMSLLFAREEAQVAVADIDTASANTTVDQITSEGGTANALTGDISDPNQVTAMVTQASGAMGGLDGIVLNVGIGAGMGLEGSTPDLWDKVLNVNLRGPMLICRAALPLMEEGGAILFISSVASIKPGSRMPSYDASKAALAGLMRHVALEAERKAIRANIVAPGLIDTPLGRLSTQGRPGRARTNIPGGRQGTGWEVAYAALFLMSGEASYINGQVLAVDAGLSTIR
ncbi:SDR family oxidoreductase [Parvibaculaceae bacterium PLY_AMNH_Bact1]|nr:SDR family oxidoreductase [Parvibaculaceae bacterium PLY_AMNH_Bact1]